MPSPSRDSSHANPCPHHKRAYRHRNKIERMFCPQNPQTQLGTTAVYHWDGEWSVGSADPSGGKGVRVQTNTWQKYQDHARHRNIVSPASGLTAPSSLSQLSARDRGAP